jgi:hypothetical protein
MSAAANRDLGNELATSKYPDGSFVFKGVWKIQWFMPFH